jgi:hypothetical protein
MCCELLSKLYLYILFATILVTSVGCISCELLSKLYLYILFATEQEKRFAIVEL